MRILVASAGTIPGYSGGWTTTLDLLGDRHSPFYLISAAPPGIRSMEGVGYLGLGLGEGPVIPDRLTGALRKALVPAAMKWAFRRHEARFVMCLDEAMGFAAMKAGLPYAMRFHRKVDPPVIGRPLETLLSGALFATATPGADVPGVAVIPHNQDLSRFPFAEPARPERALLLTCINDVHEPELFVEGVCLSGSMRGDIIGTGPARRRIQKLCRSTGGRVRCLDPIPRLELGGLSGRYQVGVATIKRRDRVVYQMKINMYLACGMHALVKPYTHIVTEAPELVDIFSSAEEMGSGLDRVQRDWQRLEDRRIRAREWITENYSVEEPRRMFEELLAGAFPGYGAPEGGDGPST